VIAAGSPVRGQGGERRRQWPGPPGRRPALTPPRSPRAASAAGARA